MENKETVYTQDELDKAVNAERKITNKMIHWAVYYWNITQPELTDEDEECKRMDEQRDIFKRIAIRARIK